MNRRDFLVASATTVTITSAGRPGIIRPATRRSTGLAVDPRQLQALLDEHARALGIVGAQLAVFDGERIYELATGFANRERRLAVDPETLFQIGSTTKLFNATLIMTLVDEGKLDLDQPVKTYIKDFALADPEATERITLRQLLSMSSGIDNGPYTDYGRGDDALDKYVAALAPIPQVFSPGTGFGYSNAGINVAGLAAERVMGKNWETLLAERVLKPLKLTHAANFPEDLLFHPVALGYVQRSGAKETVRVPVWAMARSMAPAGGTFCTTAGDMIRFARMFLQGGKAADGTQVLSEKAVRTMHTPQVVLPTEVLAHKWCTGPYWKEWDGQAIFGHSGTNSGGSSMLLWCPAKRVAIATISNVARQGYPLADRIFDTVFPEMFKIAKPKGPTPSTVKRVSVPLDRFLGRFEAYGTSITFTAENGKLMATLGSAASRSLDQPGLESEMIPLGGDRFLPAELAMSGNRNWDVAFWGKDESGRATHFLNGVFASRRTG